MDFRWIPRYEQVFEEEPTLEQLRGWLRRYPVLEWLGMLSRIQTSLVGSRISDKEWKKALFGGVLAPRVRERIVELEKKGGLGGLFSPHSVATLMQLAVLEAPEDGQASFARPDDLEVLDRALFAVFSLTDSGHSPPGALTSVQDLLARMFQDFYRSQPGEDPGRLFVRACDLWELDTARRSPEVEQLFQMFRKVRKVDPVDFMVGGLATVLHELNKSPTKLAEAIEHYPNPGDYENPAERRCRSAYAALRATDLSNFRDCIKELDGGVERMHEWSLVPTFQTPILRLPNQQLLILNVASVAASMVDGVRHLLRTAAIDGNLGWGWNIQRLEGQYGRVFESYAKRLFGELCGDRTIEIPADPRQRADVCLLGANVVALVEIKGGLLPARSRYLPCSPAERRMELEQLFRRAGEQLNETLIDLRCGRIPMPGCGSRDWTAVPVAPAVLMDEDIPQDGLLWKDFLAPLFPAELHGERSGLTSRVRILNLTDLERAADVIRSQDLARLLFTWGTDPQHRDEPLDHFLQGRGHRLTREWLGRKFEERRDFVRRHLELPND